jgi:hypothetical protein
MKFWKPQRKKCFVYWSFFCINDNKLVNLEQPQVIICLLCYNAPINVSNPRTNARNVLITHYKTNDILSLKKHVDANYHLIFEKFE